MVREGLADGFLTYPSEVRKTYAGFSVRPLFTEDIGYLFFRPDAGAKDRLVHARSLEDLRGLTLMSTVGSDWERDNIPAYVPRLEKPNDRIKLNTLVRRHEGDFTILGLEQAAWFLADLGLQGTLQWQKVDFLPDSQVDFHLGLRKDLPRAAVYLASLDRAMLNTAFQKSLRDMLNRYRP